MTATARETVLVTGSSGFIGRQVLLRLAERYTLVGLDRDPPPHSRTSAEFVGIDLKSDQSVAEALQRVRVSYGENIASVIHLAAYFDLTGKPNHDYEQVTVYGTERLIRALRAFHVEQFVFASSMLIHAPARPGQLIDEDGPLDSRALPYRESKIHAERVIREQRGSIPAVLIRPAGVYDDGGHSAFLAHQIARIYERELISHVYPGDLDTGQSYLHVDDLTAALLRIVERRRDLPPELAVLLGEPETLTARELQDAIGRLVHGEKWDTCNARRVVGCEPLRIRPVRAPGVHGHDTARDGRTESRRPGAARAVARVERPVHGRGHRSVQCVVTVAAFLVGPVGARLAGSGGLSAGLRRSRLGALLRRQQPSQRHRAHHHVGCFQSMADR